MGKWPIVETDFATTSGQNCKNVTGKSVLQQPNGRATVNAEAKAYILMINGNDYLICSAPFAKASRRLTGIQNRLL